MALRAPPDFTKVAFAVAIGVGSAFLVKSFRENNLPHTGDNLHSLPFGGDYSDGTKSVSYHGPAYRSAHLSQLKGPLPLLAVLFLIALIHASAVFGNRRRGVLHVHAA